MVSRLLKSAAAPSLLAGRLAQLTGDIVLSVQVRDDSQRRALHELLRTIDNGRDQAFPPEEPLQIRAGDVLGSGTCGTGCGIGAQKATARGAETAPPIARNGAANGRAAIR